MHILHDLGLIQKNFQYLFLSECPEKTIFDMKKWNELEKNH